MDVAVRAQNLGKRFKLYARSEHRLLEAVIPGLKLHRELWALRNISFELPAGESLAVIGPNGAGKSTLLRILAGASVPTEGSYQIAGRVGAVLELGLGFAPTLTGRQNIRLAALMMGLSLEEVDDRMHQIAAFSELGEYLDRPVREYSSGMRSRLGFSIASHLDVQVLLADEALSAGDHAFRLRAAERVRTLLERGVSLIYATHSAKRAQELCQRAIWIEYGRIMEAGPVSDVIRSYNTRGKSMVLGASGAGDGQSPRATIVAVRLLGLDGHRISQVEPSVVLQCEIDLYCTRHLDDLDLALTCASQSDAAARSLRLSRFQPEGFSLQQGFHRFRVRFKAPRVPGGYDVIVRLGRLRAVFGERFYETRVLPGALVVTDPGGGNDTELAGASWQKLAIQADELRNIIPSVLDFRTPGVRGWLRNGWCFSRNRIGPVGPAELFLYVPSGAAALELRAQRVAPELGFAVEEPQSQSRLFLEPAGRKQGAICYRGAVPPSWVGRALLLRLLPIDRVGEVVMLEPGKEPWIRLVKVITDTEPSSTQAA